MSASHPAVVILHIGENDLGDNVSADVIAGEILQLVRDITHTCRCPVHVTQLLPWPKQSKKVTDDVQEINQQLKHTLPPHQYWSHKCGLNSCNPAYFLPDSVHLNKDGMSRYYDSMRTLVGRAVKHL